MALKVVKENFKLLMDRGELALRSAWSQPPDTTVILFVDTLPQPQAVALRPASRSSAQNWMHVDHFFGQ